MSFLRILFSGKGPMDTWVARAYDRGVQAAFREMFPVLAGDLLQGIRGVRRALDAGCGPAQFTILIAESLPTIEMHGIDLAPTKSPFGAPVDERLLLGGCFWLFQGAKAQA